MTVTVKGYTTITGAPAAVLKIMQQARVFDAPEGDEYIDSVRDIALRCFDIKLDVTGSTTEERAESLLREMARCGMITITE